MTGLNKKKDQNKWGQLSLSPIFQFRQLAAVTSRFCLIYVKPRHGKEK